MKYLAFIKLWVSFIFHEFKIFIFGDKLLLVFGLLVIEMKWFFNSRI
jgi:hypothetical protein